MAGSELVVTAQDPKTPRTEAEVRQDRNRIVIRVFALLFHALGFLPTLLVAVFALLLVVPWDFVRYFLMFTLGGVSVEVCLNCLRSTWNRAAVLNRECLGVEVEKERLKVAGDAEVDKIKCMMFVGVVGVLWLIVGLLEVVHMADQAAALEVAAEELRAESGQVSVANDSKEKPKITASRTNRIAVVGFADTIALGCFVVIVGITGWKMWKHSEFDAQALLPFDGTEVEFRSDRPEAVGSTRGRSAK